MSDRHDVGRCRSCECRDIRVLWTYRASDGSIRRRRACRHCGTEFTTIERDIADLYDDDRRKRAASTESD